MVVYLRVPVYAAWSHSHRQGHILRALLEGLVAGVAVGLIGLLFPGPGGPTMAARQAAVMLIWLAVLAVVGVANALLLYAISSFAGRGFWPPITSLETSA